MRCPRQDNRREPPALASAGGLASSSLAEAMQSKQKNFALQSIERENCCFHALLTCGGYFYLTS
jgi:hypothetical protein